MQLYRIFFSVLCIASVSACSEIELASHFGKKMNGEYAQSKGGYKVGSPYKINGKKYYPNVDYKYNETGIASWYGPGFDGKATANGERFNENELTAAHKTLPLPSIVRVTNLENGKSLIVRVNDRGPYAHDRIIDMSKRSAELLGFKNRGTAKVRVQVLEAESKMVANAASNGQATRGMEVAMNKPSYKSPKLQQNIKTVALQTEQHRTIPGHINNGLFYPDPIISEQAVANEQIYIQLASLTTREQAMKFATSLDGYGRAQVQSAFVDGAQYFRVRVPTQSVSEADALLERVIADGFETALIVVD
tara:strand:- start:44 stop:961 length:918 start_codon:yes stop_codon:yes gene_type:complete